MKVFKGICLQFKNLDYICNPFAGVVELVDTLDLGSSAARCGSSSLPARTIKEKPRSNSWLFYLNPFLIQRLKFLCL